MKAIEDYLAAWNANSADERYRLLTGCMTPDVIYLDPHIVEPTRGIAELQDLMERFRQRFDHSLEPISAVDFHHQVFRLQWHLRRETRELLSRGLMVGDLTPDELIQRVVHFVDRA